MGATGWRYRVVYEEDTEAALQNLRHVEFSARRYPFRETWPKDLRRKFFFFWLVSLAVLGFHDFILKIRIGSVSSIDDLLERAGEAGTHSILDITNVSRYREFAAASPAPERLLMATFDTTRPTLNDYESYIRGDTPVDDITEDLERWQAFYFTLYEEGQPKWLCFEGYSGD